jgi:hypothetical protein
LGSRDSEWKLPRLPVAVTAALEKIWATIPDSLLRTGAGLGHITGLQKSFYRFSNLSGESSGQQALTQNLLTVQLNLWMQRPGMNSMCCLRIETLDECTGLPLPGVRSFQDSRVCISVALLLLEGLHACHNASWCGGCKCVGSLYQKLWRSLD